MKETTLQICTMKDPLCAQGIENKLLTLPGVHQMQTNAVNGTTAVHYDDTQTSIADMEKVIAGFRYKILVFCTSSSDIRYRQQ